MKTNLKQLFKKPIVLCAAAVVVFLIISLIFASITANEKSSPVYRIDLRRQYAVVTCNFRIEAEEIEIKETHRTYEVNIIDNNSFNNSKKLTKVILPPTIKSIGYNTFGSNKNLQSVSITSPTPPQLSWGSFGNNHENFKLIIPQEFSSIYTEYCNQYINGWNQGLLPMLQFV